ncbi:hypothetical protein [Lysinibacillus sphaericus]|uniref:hypothetical protein n=1 Tax=Lysinibacillus sphaericus TaxID=1421 RepID=UPI003D7FE16B
MKKLLNQKEQWYADTAEEAEEIVTEAKENEALIMKKISEKYNKYGQYFLVDLTYQYGTPKEVMEGKPDDDAPDGQLTIDEVNGEDEKLPDFEDPFTGIEEKKDDANENMPF